MRPTRRSALLFFCKSNLLRLRRRWADPDGRPGPLPLAPGAGGEILAESRTALYPSSDAAEFALQAGKVQNLRVAARCLDGRYLAAGALFSFWAHVPRPTRRGGFAPGRELRSGCLIPSIGGGICQLSNALYAVALAAGAEIVERHAHTRPVPGAAGPDATLFWNYVDLRFRLRSDARLEVSLSGTELLVRLIALAPAAVESGGGAVAGLRIVNGGEREPASCESCGVEACFRHAEAAALPREGRPAWLVDAASPEMASYAAAAPGGTLFTPWPVARGAYRWPLAGFASVRSAPWVVVRRSVASRGLAATGAARQRALLAFDAELARSYARRLPVTATHLILSQNLLPHLWLGGHLGGRTFDVLMTRLPMAAMARELDRAAARWPEAATLTDFRAEPALVAAEEAALAAARRWVTPHTAIAALAPGRTELLAWVSPAVETHGPAPGGRLLFPASTLARKGAWELREALAGTRVRLALGGPVLEGPGFWDGVAVEPAGADGLAGTAAVVLPAWVEHQPRRLLRALAAGVPVIATPACGLPPQPALTLIPPGDPAALREALAHAAGGVRVRLPG